MCVCVCVCVMPGLWVYCVCSKCNVENNLSWRGEM